MITVKIDAFEGPLDLLLHLIDQAEVDIYDISVAEITNQYVAYVQEMQELELEIASEFLVMAATLLALKSKMLLPKQELTPIDSFGDIEGDDLDTREELIQRLLEYKKYKQLALQLREKEAERTLIFTRPAEDLAPFLGQEEYNPVADISLFRLVEVFQKVLENTRDEPLATVNRDEISIERKLEEITQVITHRKRVLFTELLHKSYSRTEIVVTFLAVLELMKKKIILCQQEDLFTDIWILKGVGAEGFES